MGSSVPEIQTVGELVPEEWASGLRLQVAQLLGQRNEKFPGAQPVSFARKHLQDLKKKDYFVCEKSDGIRCLLYFTKNIHPDQTIEEVHYLVDRKNNYYLVRKLHFPRPSSDPQNSQNPDFDSFHVDTLLDGELLWDTYPDGTRLLKYLVFDCLVMDGQNLMHRTLDRRLAYFLESVLAPYHRLWKRFREDCEENFVFRVEKKATQKSYGIDMMFNAIVPKLKHTSDGLIFTCRETPYVIGTDENILKWKPAAENTIDFKLDLRFTVRADFTNGTGGHRLGAEEGDQYDYGKMPRFVLHIYGGDKDPDREFGEMHVTPEEWERMKVWAIAHDDGLDGQIVECHKDEQGRWRFNRFREDKQEANHYTVAEKVIDSIEDGVSEEDLKAAQNEIREAWKAREKLATGGR